MFINVHRFLSVSGEIYKRFPEAISTVIKLTIRQLLNNEGKAFKTRAVWFLRQGKKMSMDSLSYWCPTDLSNML